VLHTVTYDLLLFQGAVLHTVTYDLFFHCHHGVAERDCIMHIDYHCTVSSGKSSPCPCVASNDRNQLGVRRLRRFFLVIT
jgi:hypothetical protein